MHVIGMLGLGAFSLLRYLAIDDFSSRTFFDGSKCKCLILRQDNFDEGEEQINSSL